MRHRHDMPFGASYRPGETRFRLWAPACGRVRLELGRESPLSVAMERDVEGWHEAVVKDVQRGAAYAFRVADDTRAVPRCTSFTTASCQPSTSRSIATLSEIGRAHV